MLQTVNFTFYSVSLWYPGRCLANIASVPGTLVKININTKPATTVSKHL